MTPQLRSLPAVPDDPLEWRPQRPLPTRTRRDVANAIIEPMWDGDHVLAHYEAMPGSAAGPARLLLIADDGEDVTDLEADVTDLLRDAIRARDAVIDGFLTTQATRPGDSVSLLPKLKTKKLNVVSGPSVSTDVAPGKLDEATPVAFVAVDLLRLDRQDLFDIPLLERKRVLESIVVQDERVRVSPHTQPPLAAWLRTWRAAGFRGAVLKASNSRYRPGYETDEWVSVLSPAR
jgi:ATP-dependent DNA ligase